MKRTIRTICQAAAIGMLMVQAALVVANAIWPLDLSPIETWPASRIVTDVDGRVLLTAVGADEQFRRPVALAEISPWLIQATIAVEDSRFYEHPGVDAAGMARATGQNIAARRIVSGASTLDMQLARMMRDRPRTLSAKCVEIFRALQINAAWSKAEILQAYLNVAPYGGNLRGVEAASLTYFHKRAGELSLAEAAMLAGLPQSPARLRPDRYPQPAAMRQHIVLSRMLVEGCITQQQYDQAVNQPIEIRCEPRRIHAPHAAMLALSRRAQGGRTTLRLGIQNDVSRVLKEHARTLPEASDIAAVVIDVADGSIVAMIGSADVSDPVDGQVNGVIARRSPGSALKPLIYLAAMQAGRLNADATLYDVPIGRGGWRPDNFDRTFHGEVSAGRALRESLNVPAILVAEAVGINRCCGVIRSAGVDLPPGSASRGGLALAVGGIEVSLLELTNAYATLARGGRRGSVRLFADEPFTLVPALQAQACGAINDILSVRQRRPAVFADRRASDVPWFMWKTGTSSGRRDAWAVGHNGRFAVGVWVGRFAGTGRAEYVGAVAAEPLMAQIFDLPDLRQNNDPPPAEAIVVRRPIAPPREAAETLHIAQPSDGERFIAPAGRAVVPVIAQAPRDACWLLNGRIIDSPIDRRFELTPGSYILQCVDAKGRNDSVSFSVTRDVSASIGSLSR